MEPREGTQSARKHKAIIDAATGLFLRKGYQDTSVEEIAALAAVGKQTVYKHFADKQRLFSAIILGNITTAEGFTTAAADILRDTDDLQRDLREGRPPVPGRRHAAIRAAAAPSDHCRSRPLPRAGTDLLRAGSRAHRDNARVLLPGSRRARTPAGRRPRAGCQPLRRARAGPATEPGHVLRP